MGKRVNKTNSTNNTPGKRKSSKKETKAIKDNICDNLVKPNLTSNS